MDRSRFATPVHLAPFATVGMALAIILSACGSSASPSPTPPPDPKAVLTRSATSLTALKSFHLEVSLAGTINNPSGTGPTSVTLDGTKVTADVDVANQKGSVALIIPSALLTSFGMTGTASSGDFADVMFSGDLYLKSPTLVTLLGAMGGGATTALVPDKWVKIPAASLQALASQYSGMAAGLVPSIAPASSPSADSSAIASFLASSGITITSQGTDSCADGTCNKFLITVPASALQKLAALGGSTGTSAAALGALGDTTITLWTGASNDRFNKLSATVTAGASGSVTFTIALSDFDKAVTITPPADDQVQSFPGL